MYYSTQTQKLQAQLHALLQISRILPKTDYFYRKAAWFIEINIQILILQIWNQTFWAKLWSSTNKQQKKKSTLSKKLVPPQVVNMKSTQIIFLLHGVIVDDPLVHIILLKGLPNIISIKM